MIQERDIPIRTGGDFWLHAKNEEPRLIRYSYAEGMHKPGHVGSYFEEPTFDIKEDDITIRKKGLGILKAKDRISEQDLLSAKTIDEGYVDPEFKKILPLNEKFGQMTTFHRLVNIETEEGIEFSVSIYVETREVGGKTNTRAKYSIVGFDPFGAYAVKIVEQQTQLDIQEALYKLVKDNDIQKHFAKKSINEEYFALVHGYLQEFWEENKQSPKEDGDYSSLFSLFPEMGTGQTKEIDFIGISAALEFLTDLLDRLRDMDMPHIKEKVQEAIFKIFIRITELASGALLGDYIKNPNGWMIAGQVAVGFVPLVGQIADVRDLVLSLKRIIVDGRYDEAEEWIALGFIMIAFIPGVGDVIKAARRPIIQFIRTLVAAAPELTKRLTKEILPELRELLSGKIDDLMEWAEKKYGKNLDETLEKNPKKSKFEGKEEVAKGVDRAAKYSSEWGSSSLKNAIDRFAPGSMGVKIPTGKTVYLNSETGIQVVADDAGNYFRIENTKLTGKRRYLDLDGNIPNNKVVKGKTLGRSQAEYNQETHFNNID